LTFGLIGFPEERLNETTCPTCQIASAIGPFIAFQKGNYFSPKIILYCVISLLSFRISPACCRFSKVFFRFSANDISDFFAPFATFKVAFNITCDKRKT
tara:strand:+ start:116 stop:412 length:297 start_codon:yes stop_codon:yes gene_type:complete